jgi:hypothetical protein
VRGREAKHPGHYSPAEAIAKACDSLRRNRYRLTPGAGAQLQELLNSLGKAGQHEMEEALQTILQEIRPADYRAPRDPEPVPGISFIWVSKYFGKEVYFKFKLVGSRKKPLMVIYSCHPPGY